MEVNGVIHDLSTLFNDRLRKYRQGLMYALFDLAALSISDPGRAKIFKNEIASACKAAETGVNTAMAKSTWNLKGFTEAMNKQFGVAENPKEVDDDTVCSKICKATLLVFDRGEKYDLFTNRVTEICREHLTIFTEKLVKESGGR